MFFRRLPKPWALALDWFLSIAGAIAFVLSHPAVTGAIVGVRNERDAAELAPAARLRLTPDELAAIAALTAQ